MTLSAMAVMRSVVKLAVYQTLYAAGMVFVFVSVWSVLSFVEYNIGFYDFEPGIGLDNFTTIYANGDIVAAVAILVIGGFVFGVLGQALMWLERLHRPTVWGHIRYCIALYVISGFLGITLISAYEANFGANVPAGSLTAGYIAAILCFFIASYAIILNALTLMRKRRRNSVNSGGAA